MSGVDTSMQQQVQALYSAHHGWLFGWLRARLGCAHNAEDVAQDTFVRILSSREALGLREPHAWLTTTARRLMIDQARRRQIERAYLAELAVQLEQPGAAPSPERIHRAVDALVRIATALEGLAPRPRQAFVLHDLDGLPHRDIALELGVSVRMVQKYLVQALLHGHTAMDAA